MAGEDFTTNLMKFVAANLDLMIRLQLAQDMFGKSYHSLGNMEKIALDEAVLGMVSTNYHRLTPEYLSTQKSPQQPVGFQGPGTAPKQE